MHDLTWFLWLLRLLFLFLSLQVAESRDPKGLYAKFRAGEVQGVTGLDDPFEVSTHPDQIVIDTSTTSVVDAVGVIWGRLEADGVVDKTWESVVAEGVITTMEENMKRSQEATTA